MFSVNLNFSVYIAVIKFMPTKFKHSVYMLKSYCQDSAAIYDAAEYRGTDWEMDSPIYFIQLLVSLCRTHMTIQFIFLNIYGYFKNKHCVLIWNVQYNR